MRDKARYISYAIQILPQFTGEDIECQAVPDGTNG